jgi:DNA-directed RNA polymerase specialized sigma24 family protein
MIQTLTVSELAHRCGEETARYLRGEPRSDRFCFELFRRAVIERDEAAWAAVLAQYREPVRHWLGGRQDDADDGVSAAFERFWHAISPEKFARFTSLPAILQYLKMCAHTVTIDRLRTSQLTAMEQTLDEAPELPDAGSIEELVASKVDAAAFWHEVQQILGDEREQRVIYFSYVIGLTPRAICAHYAGEFPSVQDVYRLKRLALDRLRRAPTLMRFADDGTNPRE